MSPTILPTHMLSALVCTHERGLGSTDIEFFTVPCSGSGPQHVERLLAG